MLKPFHHIETNWKKTDFLRITLEVTFTLLHIACVNFSQPSVPPVTLISSGARRTGILATEADTPALFVQWERACLLAFSYVAYAKCEHLCTGASACRRTSAETECWNAKRHLACNGSGFIGIWEQKAVYREPFTVSTGNNNAVRQGLVSPFLCFTSPAGVYAPTSSEKERIIVLHASYDMGLRANAASSQVTVAKRTRFWHSQHGCPLSKKKKKKSNLQQLDLIKWRRINGRHPEVSMWGMQCVFPWV